MLIWSGKGLWVPVIVFACAIGTEFGVEWATGDDTYYQTANWPLTFALLASAALIWVWGVRLSEEPGRRLIDPATNEEVVLEGGSRHRFFWIPVRFWAPVLAFLGLTYLVGG